MQRVAGVVVAAGLLLGGGAVAVAAGPGAGEDATVQQYELTCKSGDDRFAYSPGSRAGQRVDQNHNGFVCGRARQTPRGTVYTGPYYDDF